MFKTFVGAGCVFLLAFTVLASNDPMRVWSQPSPPSQEALDRLNLQSAWAVHVPMDGRRDGFASIQVNGDQLIVQTRSGLITILDAENGGRALWRSRPAAPTRPPCPRLSTAGPYSPPTAAASSPSTAKRARFSGTMT